MDKYDYVITKPEMEEVLYHAGFHKYIDKYLGKNGKWIYKYAGQAKSAATGAVNKARTMLPGLQKQATGAVTTARKAVSTAASTGSRTVSAAKAQAKKRISAMLPNLFNKLNKTKKRVRSQAAGVKLVAKSKINKTKNKLSEHKPKTPVKTTTKKTATKKQSDPTKKSVAKYRTKNNGPFPSDWNDLRFRGYSNSMTNAGERGMRTNVGISAGRKRAAKKRKK